MIRNNIVLSIAVLACFASILSSCTDNTVPSYPALNSTITDKPYQFEATPVWADEFDVDGSVNPNKWTFETGASGWGNNEKQYYTDGQNVEVSGGTLKIFAKKESRDGADYTSSRLITRAKGDWTYGRFESRIKLPTGKGLWPAFWMLSTDNTYGNWPKSGEIDIMENVGYDPFKVHVSVHTEAYNHVAGTQKTRDTTCTTVQSDFHKYRVDWTPFAVRGYFDDAKVFEFTNQNAGYSKYPFNNRFFIILNLAVGGNWGGALGIDDSIFPAKMEVDYVRVYKLVQ